MVYNKDTKDNKNYLYNKYTDLNKILKTVTKNNYGNYLMNTDSCKKSFLYSKKDLKRDNINFNKYLDKYIITKDKINKNNPYNNKNNLNTIGLKFINNLHFINTNNSIDNINKNKSNKHIAKEKDILTNKHLNINNNCYYIKNDNLNIKKIIHYNQNRLKLIDQKNITIDKNHYYLNTNSDNSIYKNKKQDITPKINTNYDMKKFNLVDVKDSLNNNNINKIASDIYSIANSKNITKDNQEYNKYISKLNSIYPIYYNLLSNKQNIIKYPCLIKHLKILLDELDKYFHLRKDKIYDIIKGKNNFILNLNKSKSKLKKITQDLIRMQKTNDNLINMNPY